MKQVLSARLRYSLFPRRLVQRAMFDSGGLDGTAQNAQTDFRNSVCWLRGNSTCGQATVQGRRYFYFG